MRYIDLENWPRQEHFSVFRDWDYPHFNLCADVDLTAFYPFIKQNGISFNIAIVYLITRTANAIPEFRYRIRDGKLIEHETVHPSSTILGKDDVFSFCTMEYHESFSQFSFKAAKKIARVQKRPRLMEEDHGDDNLLFMTAIPWVSFTSFMHPLRFPVDSVPRFAWGKFYEDGNLLKMPFSIQGHHAVMDGIHMGKFYAEMQTYLTNPEKVLA